MLGVDDFDDLIELELFLFIFLKHVSLLSVINDLIE